MAPETWSTGASRPKRGRQGPPRSTLAPESLADADSRFAEVKGLQLHYKASGQGEPNLVLLHGFAANLFSWRGMIAPLAERHRVVAFDRPGFGLSARPLPGEWTGDNPYSRPAQADLTAAFLDELGLEEAVLVGHSAGGTIAVLTAQRHPHRVKALALLAPAIYTQGGAPRWTLPLLSNRLARWLGPRLLRALLKRGDRLFRMAWHDRSKVTGEMLAGHAKPFRVKNWDCALWEFLAASRPVADLVARLREIAVPVLVISGRDDRFVPAEQSERLASELADAELCIIPECGHIPHEECPTASLQAMAAFLDKLA
jgi:pimeloyl-ACP methyl ester carboxylesterase